MALVFTSLSIAVLSLADLFGTGYSPGWEDILDLLLIGACFSLCIFLVIVGLGSIILIRTHWIHLGIAILLLPIAAVQAHPYLTAWDALRNAEIDTDLNVPGPSTTEIRAIRPYPPKHDWRATSDDRDFNGDGQKELVVLDSYTWPGTCREFIVDIEIYKVQNSNYSLIFSQSVDEQRYYSFYKGCPEKSSCLGHHSSIHFLNLDADRQVEIFAHQATSTSPPDCRFDYYYDWKDGVAQPFYPIPFWLVERGFFFFGLPIIVLVLGLARKKPFSAIALVGSVLYFVWSLFEAWLSVGFRVWAIMSGSVVAATVLKLVIERHLHRKSCEAR